MNQLQHYIKNYFGISDKHLSTLADMFIKEEIAKSDFFLREGEYCNRLSFIIKGNVRIFYANDNGKEVTQWISTDGDFITDLGGMMFRKKVKKNVQALSKVDIYSIYRENYEKIGQVVPEWHTLEKLFIAKCFIMLEERVSTFLSMNSRERYEHFFALRPHLFNQVPLQYLASMLGMTPETLSRIRSTS